MSEGRPPPPTLSASASGWARPASSTRRPSHYPSGGNFWALGAAHLVAVISGLFVQFYLARSLGAASYGVYGFVVTVASILVFVARMNLPILLSREVARAPATAGARLGTGLLTNALLGMVATGAIVLWTLLEDGRFSVVRASAVAGAAVLTASLYMTAQGVFQGLRRMKPLVPSAVIGRLTFVVATVAAVSLNSGLDGVFAAQIVGSATSLAVLLIAFHARVGRISMRVGMRRILQLVREARSFGLHQLFATIYLTADVVILKALRSDYDVGLYRAAAVLILQLPIVASTLSLAILPRMARHVGDRKAAGKELSFALRTLLLVSLPLAVGGLCVARPLMVLLGSEAYRSAWVALAIMLPILPLRYVNSLIGTTLTALNHQPSRTRGVLYAAIFNVVANLLAIPRWGVMGAAVTTAGTELLLSVLLVRSTWRLVTGVSVADPLIRGGGAALGMAGLVLALHGWPVAPRIGVGAGLYVLLSYLMRAWSPSDLNTLARI